MKKVISSAFAFISALRTFAIDPSGSRVDFDDGGIDIPLPLLIIGLVVATVACLYMGLSKGRDGKRNSPEMLWLGVIGVIGLILIFGSL